MKKLIIINGTMGVGKTTTCKSLKELLTPSVFLDGDWCWDMKPFIVNDETKAMVTDNISHLLRNYLNCSVYDYVIFCWVLHRESIIDELIEKINLNNYELHKITLTCTPEALEARLLGDIRSGIRDEVVLERSKKRQKMYLDMDTYKIDVSEISQYEAAKQIVQVIDSL